MSEYQLELKQVVDYPRCRIYRQFISMLMKDKSIRIGGSSGLYYFTVLSCYANFRTSYKRIDGISYTIYPGEWLCRVSELTEWFRTRFQHQALSINILCRQVSSDIPLPQRVQNVISKYVAEGRDTNSDFDDLDGAIRSGYLLKDGLSNNEDFYYMNILITITADTPEDLEWREREMRKLLVSQDLNIVTCSFREEQGFLSALPLTSLEKHLYERSKRNVLTSGAASCYPFTAYELSDDNGILLGVNKYNNSLVIVDIFNSVVYKNANISIMGTSGAGKTFTLQLMALRMRRKGTQVFIIAPLKGHEFLRACRNTGGEFIQISPASKNCINVMEIRKTDKSVDELLDGSPIEKSELAAKIQQLHIFFSLLIPDMNHEERQLLDEALIKTYNGKGITHDNESL